MTDFDRVKEINRLAKVIAESTEDDYIDEFYELSRGKIRFFEDILLEIQDLLDRREL
jgi:hypothetical protein